MPSSYTNGVYTSTPNGIGKQHSRASGPHRFKNNHTIKQQHQLNNKGVRGTKLHQTTLTPNAQNQSDGLQSSASRQPSSNQSSTNSLPTFSAAQTDVGSIQSAGCNSVSTGTTFISQSDTRTNLIGQISPNNLMVYPDSALPATAASNPMTKPDSALSHSLTAGMMAAASNVRDTSSLSGYAAATAQYPTGYIPSLQCSTVPSNCSSCYPLMLDSAGFPVVSGAPQPQPIVQQRPLLLSRPLIAGIGPNAATAGSPAPGAVQPGQCYVWLNQDLEAAQKQLYQTQMALSQLSLNPAALATVNQSSGLSSECSAGIPYGQPNQNSYVSEAPVSSLQTHSQLVTPSSNQDSTSTSANAYPGTAQLVASSVGGACPANMQPCTMGGSGNSASHLNASMTNNALANPLGYQNSQLGPVGLCVECGPPENSQVWSNAAAYPTANGMWVPPSYAGYAPSYYQAFPLPVGPVSPPSLVGYDETTNPMHPNAASMDRCFSSSALSSSEKNAANVSLQDYYASSVAKLAAMQKSYPLQLMNSSMYVNQPTGPTTIAQPLNYSAFNNSGWQALLSTLAASKNASSLVQNPLSATAAYNLDRSSMSGGRRRLSSQFTARSTICKGFDEAELATLSLNVNPSKFDESLLVRTRYFVIKSDCEYNVHQSIRHGVWCSTRAGNQCLEDAYQSVTNCDHNPCSQETASSTASNGTPDSTQVKKSSTTNSSSLSPTSRGHILLFFSVRSSGYLSGVAEMTGPVNPQKRCSIWLDARFRGEIPVRWLYVKNVPNHLLKHISIESYDNRPVTVLRDTSEILPASKGEELLRIVHEFGLPRSVSLAQPY
ncbi:unnamed protein product [Calicophoron daubneyi]|uniref:YTH domain-containing protein n=1 Tax=Calicophoron daubneyi TaxID=300641 RepID=A0AAV2SYS8_CALDB